MTRPVDPSPKERHGQPVNIRYVDGYDVVYLHGHVEPEEAARLAAVFVRDERIEHGDADEGDPLPRYGRAKHRRARWSFPTAEMRDEGYTRMFYDHADGRGSFPITVLVDLDDAERWEREQAEHRALADRMRTEVAALYPEATEIKVHPWGIGKVHIALTLPGLGRHVDVESDKWPGTVGIDASDAEAWERLYQGRTHRLEEPHG